MIMVCCKVTRSEIIFMLEITETNFGFEFFYLVDGTVHNQLPCLDLINRRTLIYAVNQDAERAFKKTVEVDRLIDMLRDANDQEVRPFSVVNHLGSFFYRIVPINLNTAKFPLYMMSLAYIFGSFLLCSTSAAMRHFRIIP